MLATKSNLFKVMDWTIAAVCPLMHFKGKKANKPKVNLLCVWILDAGNYLCSLKGILAFQVQANLKWEMCACRSSCYCLCSLVSLSPSLSSIPSFFLSSLACSCLSFSYISIYQFLLLSLSLYSVSVCIQLTQHHVDMSTLREWLGFFYESVLACTFSEYLIKKGRLEVVS